MIAKNEDHSRYHTEKFSTIFFVEIHASVNNQRDYLILFLTALSTILLGLSAIIELRSL